MRRKPVEAIFSSAICLNSVQVHVSCWYVCQWMIEKYVCCEKKEHCLHPPALHAGQRRMPCHWRGGSLLGWVAGEAAGWCECYTLIPHNMGDSNKDEHEEITLTENNSSFACISCKCESLLIPSIYHIDTIIIFFIFFKVQTGEWNHQRRWLLTYSNRNKMCFRL